MICIPGLWRLPALTPEVREQLRAIDLAPRKIRVNSVHPGPIDTEMLKVRTPDQIWQRRHFVPVKRMGTAEEVASLGLLSAQSDIGKVAIRSRIPANLTSS